MKSLAWYFDEARRLGNFQLKKFVRPKKFSYVQPYIPPKLRSYYNRRRDYFSRFDQGIQMD